MKSLEVVNEQILYGDSSWGYTFNRFELETIRQDLEIINNNISLIKRALRSHYRSIECDIDTNKRLLKVNKENKIAKLSLSRDIKEKERIESLIKLLNGIKREK